MKGFRSCNRLLGRFKFHKGISLDVSRFPKFLQNHSYPSDIFLSSRGIKMASSLVLPTVFSFFSKNLTSFCLLSSGTTGKPSMTTKASKPCSSLTSYCAWRSAGNNENLKTGCSIIAGTVYQPVRSRSSSDSFPSSSLKLLKPGAILNTEQ